MPSSLLSCLRFAAAWLTGRAAVAEHPITLDRGDRTVPADLYLPRARSLPPHPWVVLHGITVPGRRHAELRRFARAMAGTGAAVLVPEVPEWSRLELAPHLTAPTVDAALRHLEGFRGLGETGAALMGFSFGAPQAVAASTDPSLRGRLTGVAGFGGYYDLKHTVRFLLTGVHEWNGRRERLSPDPYGRWVVMGNYLDRIPGHEDAGDVARALRELATEAGRVGAPSWEPVYDELKAELRNRVAPGRRRLWDLLVRPSGRPEPEPGEVEELVEGLVETASGLDPLMAPASSLEGVRLPVRLVHGRGDRLIPYTETLRAARALEARTDVEATITRLFAHSSQDSWPHPVRFVREAGVFLRALRGVFELA